MLLKWNLSTYRELIVLSYTIHQINSKWTEDLIEIPETIKLPEENIDSTLCDISLQNFLDLSPYVREIKAKTEMGMGNENKKKWECIKLKRFCRAKETTKQRAYLMGRDSCK